jgi:hypothetical protein
VAETDDVIAVLTSAGAIDAGRVRLFSRAAEAPVNTSTTCSSAIDAI